jgi:DNA-binding NtrC family response regulator
MGMGWRVLVVEDDGMVREALAAVLRERHQVVTASGAREAIAHFVPAADGFDAVLCDLQLGDGDAVQVCAAFARGRPRGEYGFIVMTGGACAEELLPFVRRMPHVISKPFDFEETLRLIDSVVGG